MPHRVEAELVGNVASVSVRVGDHVTPADILVILESMKMEIPVHPEVAGVVVEVAVTVGDVVHEGDTIVVLEEHS